MVVVDLAGETRFLREIWFVGEWGTPTQVLQS
jgi:hypothetical protein